MLIPAISLMVLYVFAEPWSHHQSSLRSLQTKIESREEEMQHLIEEKKQNKDRGQLAHVLERMTVIQKEIREFRIKLAVEREHIRFEHPEKGEKIELDERASAPPQEDDLEAQVQETKKTIINTYGPTKQNTQERAPASAPSPSPTPESQRIRFSM